MTDTITYSDVVDIERYPIHDLDSELGQMLVQASRMSLLAHGICQLEGFVRLAAVEETLAQAAALSEREWASESTHTVYFTSPDEAQAETHPLRRQVRSAKKALAYDLIPDGAPLKRLYESDDMLRFIGAVLGVEPLYRSDDPLDCLEIASFHPGDELGWHFDNSEFSVTLMLQEPESGGDFDYYPALRSDDVPNYEGVQYAIDSDGEGSIRIGTAPGTLAVFHGHHALHRVTPVTGDVTRINSVLTYGDRPGMRLSELTQQLFYGRNVQSGEAG